MCFHLPLSTSLLFWGVVEELWLVVVEAVIVFGSGVVGLLVPCPHAHSTHDCIHSIPLSRDLPCSPSRVSLRGLFVPSFGLFTLA